MRSDLGHLMQSVTVKLIVTKLQEHGFTPEDFVEELPAADESPTAEFPADTPANSPDVAPEAEPAISPAEEPMEPAEGKNLPDAAAPTPLPEDDAHLTISIPRKLLPDDALARLRQIVANKEVLFKRAVMSDTLPIETTEDEVSFSWFTLTGTDGEAEAYAQFITALCQMAKEQKRILDKPYDGDNDRFAMRIFMVRMGMKGDKFALARKLMMKHLTGNSGWRYGAPPKKNTENLPDTTMENDTSTAASATSEDIISGDAQTEEDAE